MLLSFNLINVLTASYDAQIEYRKKLDKKNEEFKKEKPDFISAEMGSDDGYNLRRIFDLDLLDTYSLKIKKLCQSSKTPYCIKAHNLV